MDRGKKPRPEPVPYPDQIVWQANTGPVLVCLGCPWVSEVSTSLRELNRFAVRHMDFHIQGNRVMP